MTDQPVEIRHYDPAWPDMFADQCHQVSAVLQHWLARPVEHIGSTSVPGLPAKPVVDMLAPVRSLDDARDAVDALDEAGWSFWPEDPCRHYRLWFLRPRPQERTHHLHVIAHDDPHAVALLAFRDALRGDSALRDEYARLKRDLAREHRDNRNAYSNAKSDFVERVLREAGIPPAPRDPLPE
jgi:GrpB-like predicted nucleotidyltransferase (UPF0157 family)